MCARSPDRTNTSIRHTWTACDANVTTLQQVGDLGLLCHGQLGALYKNKMLKLNLSSNFKLFNFSGRKTSGLTERTRVTRTAWKRDTLRREHHIHVHEGQKILCDTKIHKKSLKYVTNCTYIFGKDRNVRKSFNIISGFPGSVHVGFVVDKVALVKVYSRVLLFSSVNFIPPVLHIWKN
jgi:hypothetical protein